MKEYENKIVSTFTKGLKDNYIKSLVQGMEVATQMYLDRIKDGCTMEELKSFMEKNLDKKNLKLMEKVVKGEKKWELKIKK